MALTPKISLWHGDEKKATKRINYSPKESNDPFVAAKVFQYYAADVEGRRWKQENRCERRGKRHAAALWATIEAESHLLTY